MDSDSTKSGVGPIYHQIAVYIATKIVNGHYREGERLRGRSTLAGHYNVSPETIRRAVSLLQGMGILTALPKVGIEIVSVENALAFVEKYRDIQSLTSRQNAISELLTRSEELGSSLRENVKDLLEQIERYKTLNPFLPFELEVQPQSHIVGRTIGEVNFWHNTNMTIVGVKRSSQTIISPGPHLPFEGGDILLLVGSEASLHLARSFIEK